MFTNAFRPVIDDMKLRKFKVEGISGENILSHPQGGNFEFKIFFFLFLLFTT